jgi:hypothetical protein
MTAPSVTDLERIATEATAAGIDPVLALAEVTDIVDHGDDWITVTGVHLSRSWSGVWYGTVAAPQMQVGSALIGGTR